MALSILFVRGLLETLEHHGIERATFLAVAGFDERRIDALENRITLEEYDQLHELALDMTGDEAFGLHLGESASAATYCLVGQLVEHAATLRHALEALMRFHKLVVDPNTWRLVEAGSSATFLCDLAPGSERARRVRTETTLIGLYRMVRYFARDARPRVSFDYPAPAHVAEYERVFDGAARFEQPFSGLVIDRALLEAKTFNHDAEFHAMLETQAEKRVSRITRSMTYSERVREVLQERPEVRQRGDMSAVARALGLSARSLRRRLTEEGVSFQRVTETALAGLARQLLADEAQSIEATAYAMGFSDPSAFHRAFKRWTGTTPKAYRAQRRGGSDDMRQ